MGADDDRATESFPGFASRIHSFGHRLLPVLVIEIGNDDGHRRSDRLAAADSADDLRLIVLDLHPPTPPVPVLPARQIAIDPLPIEPHAGRHAGHDDRELRPMRLAGGFKSEFAQYSS